MNLFRRNRVLAWLAAFAMLLAVGAPVLSQVLLGDAAANAAGWCGEHPLADDASPDSRTPDTRLCGYCDLLNHHPLLPGVARLPAFVPVDADRPSAALAISPISQRPLRYRAPRGPPRFVNA